MWKNIVKPNGTQEKKTAHAHYMLDTKGCKRTLSVSNTYCFSTAKWLHLSASVLSHTYIARLVLVLIRFRLEQ